MSHHRKFFIDGAWVEPDGQETLDVINPATEEVVTAIALGQASDVDKAVAAARRAFESFSLTTREERLALLERVLECYRARADDLVEAVMSEMGAPLKLARSAQVPVGASHISNTRKALESFEFSEE
ncbi:MAG: aldehyde dehydrogenase family protein, partial [Martelella sp.]